ncbi:MAG: hypothetical protein RLZZ214_1885 [Verrucomicrobiota bacterium]|jgi:autotransporter-associated beta strand protein
MKPHFQTHPKFLPTLITVCGLLTGTTAIHAATVTKADTGSSLNDAASWVAASTPTVADTATWGATSLSSGLTLSSGASWLSIDALGALTDIDISGAGALTLGAGGINAVKSIALGNPVVLGTAQTWATAATFQINASGSVSGAGQLTADGTGAVNLSGSNNYSGGTILQGTGTLGLASANALGSGGLILQSSRANADETLTLSGGITVSNAITVSLNAGREGITNTTGNNTLSGAINFTGSASTHTNFKNIAGVGTLFTLSGSIAAPSMTEGLSFRGDIGNLGLISGQVNLNGFFELNGGATWTIFSTGNNWNQTRIQGVDDGGFTLGVDNALATKASLWFGNNTDGALDLAGFNQTVGGIDCANSVNNPKIGNSSTSSDSLLRINGGGQTFIGSLVDSLNGGTRTLSIELLSGDQTLSGLNNSYTGTTTISGGNLVVNGALAAGSAVTVKTGGALTGTGTVNGPVTLQSGGTLTGTGTINGTVTIQSGGIRIGSGTVNGEMTVQAGGVLAGTGFVNAGVTVQNGGTLMPGDGINTASLAPGSLTLGATGSDSQSIKLAQGLSSVAVTGSLIANGTTLLDVDAATSYATGVSTLITYAGPTVTGGFALAMPPRVVANLAYSPGAIDLNVTDAGDTAKWTGSASGIWDTAAGNWQLVTAGTPTTYLPGTGGSPGDIVLFDNSLVGNPAITLNTVVSPGNVTFDNADYSLSGSGSIAGTTGLTMSGTGTLTLNTANTFTGPVNVTGGTLAVGHASAFGSTISGTTVANGAGLSMSGGVTVAGEALSIRGAGLGNVGALRNISGDNSWTGDITLSNSCRFTSNSGTLTLGNIVASTRAVIMNGPGNVTINGNITGTTAAVTVDNAFDTANPSGTLTLKGVDTFTGAMTVTNGTLSLEGNRTAASGAIIVGNGPAQTGTMKVKAGYFSTGGNTITVGDNATGTGIVDHTAGTLSTASTFVLVGGAAGSTGTYNLSGGILYVGFNNINGLILGTNNGASGVFNLSGTGTLNVNAGGNATLQVGRSNSTTTSSTGTFNQSGGAALVRNLAMGGGGVNNDHTISQLNLTGGVFNVTGNFSTLSAGDTSSSTILIGGTADVTLPAFPFARGAGPSTASITFNGGTLKPTAASAAYMGGLTNAFLTANGANFNVPTGKDITISQVFENAPSQTGTLTKAGSGKLTLTGLNTYSGSTIVNAGTLAVNGTAIPGKLVINGGKVEPTGTEVVSTLFFGAAQQAAGTWGASGSGATNINDTYFSGTGVVSVTSGSAGYSSWAAAYAPGQTADQDHDYDGVKNGLEYFMGATGSTFTANPAPVNGKVTWPKDPSFSGTYFIQTSNTMAAGSWINVPVNGINPKDYGTSVEYTLPTGQGKIFTRLQVTPN